MRAVLQFKRNSCYYKVLERGPKYSDFDDKLIQVGRGGHGPGRPGTSPREARPIVRYVGCRPRSRNFISSTHRHEPAWAGPQAERSFPLFFILKLSKIQKNNIKHGPGSRKARVRPADKFLKFQAHSGPPLMDLGPTRHLLKPDTCPPLQIREYVTRAYIRRAACQFRNPNHTILRVLLLHLSTLSCFHHIY